MTDFWTYLFYSAFLIIIIVFSKYLLTEKRLGDNFELDFRKPGIYIFMLFYTINIGLRYNVGRDYYGYTQWYKILEHSGNFPIDNDFGFIWLNKFLVGLELESYWLFVSIAFLQIFFLILVLKKLSFLRVWYFFFFFTCLLFFVSMNAMRQTLAFIMFMYILQLFFERKFIKMLLIALFAFSMHKTVVILLITLPFLKLEWFKNVRIQLGLLVLSALVLPRLFEFILSFAAPLINLLGYNYYLEHIDLMKEITDENARGDGLSIFLFFFIDLFIILHYSKMKEKFQSFNFIQYYNLFIIGIILSRIFAENFILARISDYFIHFRIIILAFLMYYIFRLSNYSKHNIIRSISVVLCICMILFYYKAIFNNAADVAPFQYYFNHD